MAFGMSQTVLDTIKTRNPSGGLTSNVQNG